MSCGCKKGQSVKGYGKRVQYRLETNALAAASFNDFMVRLYDDFAFTPLHVVLDVLWDTYSEATFEEFYDNFTERVKIPGFYSGGKA